MEERRIILSREIAEQAKKGYRLIHETDTTAQMKIGGGKLFCGDVLLGAITLGLWWIFRLIMFLFFSEGMKYGLLIEVMPDGEVRKTQT